MTDSDYEHLKELFYSELNGLRELIKEQKKANEESRDLLAKNNNDHFSALNNEEARLKEYQETTVTRELYESHHKEVVDDLTELKEWRANQIGKASQTSVMIAWLIAGIGTAIGIINLLIR